MKTVLLDPEDEHLRVFYSIDSNNYAVLERNKVRYLIHRVIMNCPEGMDVDHINGIRTDNRRCNLRICTRSQNAANSKIRVDSKTGYKGVSTSSRNKKKWEARITVNYKVIQLGTYLSPEEAAKAYNLAALKYFGEFAKLNTLK
jgi:hypothetical protein